MPSFPFGETVTRQRASLSADETELDWSDPDELVIAGVGVAPSTSTESEQTSRSRLDVGFTLYLPFGADVEPLDRVIVRGATFNVQGARSDWQNPFTGAEPGSVVEVRRTAG